MESWRKIQKKNFTKLADLLSFLELENTSDLLTKKPSFVLNVPLRLAEKMKKKDVKDPLFRQFVPLKEEQEITEGFKENPTDDPNFQLTPKLLQKYSGRALLLPTSACAMHCRYCFRQNFPYEKKTSLEKELEALKKDPTLQEVILSGGDPLSLGNEQLKKLLEELDTISHIKLIRFHSRFLIGIPERIDTEFLQILRACSKQITFVIHSNHPKELDLSVERSLKKIAKLGIPLLCQTVLLKGVNDKLNVLENLIFRLLEMGVIPYYLHQLDPIQGGKHFEVEKSEGLQLIKELRKRVPGYGLFRFVQELPGKSSKTEVTSGQPS